MSDKTWNVIQRWKVAKLCSDALVCAHEVETARAEYWSLISGVKRLLCRDKRKHVDADVTKI